LDEDDNLDDEDLNTDPQTEQQTDNNDSMTQRGVPAYLNMPLMSLPSSAWYKPP
jgi:hypothetical protein